MQEVKKIYKQIVVSFITLLLILGFILVCKKYNSSNSFNCILDGTLEYSVKQKEGSIEGDNTNKQDLYVSSVVDNIIVDFNYKLTIDNDINYQTRYEVNSFVISELDDSTVENKEVFRKKQNIINTSYNKLSNISNRVHLNYDHYNAIANEYNYSVNIPVKSKLLLQISIFVKFDDGLEKEYKQYLSLPLEKNTFSISVNNKQYKETFVNDDINIKDIVLNVLIIIVVIIYIIITIIQLNKFIKIRQKHYLEFKYRKIIKDYDNIIVPINALPKDKDIISIKVLYFKSMIDIQKELHLPILCYNSQDFIVYIILNNKQAYIYFLNSTKEKI